MIWWRLLVTVFILIVIQDIGHAPSNVSCRVSTRRIYLWEKLVDVGINVVSIAVPDNVLNPHVQDFLVVAWLPTNVITLTILLRNDSVKSSRNSSIAGE
jgi:hypothetical protein